MSRDFWAQSYSSGWNMSRSLASIHSIIYQGEPIHKFCKFVSKIFFEGEMVSLSCARIWLLKTIWNIFVVRTEDKLRSNFCYIFIIFSWYICAEHFNDEYENVIRELSEFLYCMMNGLFTKKKFSSLLFLFQILVSSHLGNEHSNSPFKTLE